jgi:tetratricopeptide (TPR) repeat protein
MTRTWIKNELKKNHLEQIIINCINYYKSNKNNVFVGMMIIIILVLFAGMIIRNRYKETQEASKLFVFAQNDFDRFNYNEAIKKFNDIEKNYGATSIMPQVLYFKGLAYYRQGNYDEAEKAFKKSINTRKNKIVSEVRIALASIYEDMNKYDMALEQYNIIEDNEYLKPEALTAVARIYELTVRNQQAIDTYTKIQSHYVNTYWGNFAKQRLAALGAAKESDELFPELDLK